MGSSLLRRLKTYTTIASPHIAENAIKIRASRSVSEYIVPVATSR